MQYTIADVRPHPAIPGCSSVTLNHPDPSGQYSTWKVSFDPKDGTPIPVAGTVIETDLDKKIAQNGSEYYWIRGYQVAGQPTAQPNGPQQAAQALNIIPPPLPSPPPVAPPSRYRDATNPEDQRNIQECTKLDREYQAVATIVAAIVSDWNDVAKNDATSLSGIVQNVAHAIRSGMATSQTNNPPSNESGW